MEKTARFYRFTVTVARRNLLTPSIVWFFSQDSVSAALKTLVSVYPPYCDFLLCICRFCYKKLLRKSHISRL